MCRLLPTFTVLLLVSATAVDADVTFGTVAPLPALWTPLTEAAQGGQYTECIGVPAGTTVCAEQCSKVLLCMGGSLDPIVVDKCGDDSKCDLQQGACVKGASCGTETTNITCNALGMFPDPYDCTVYHICCLGSEKSDYVACDDGWAYDPITTLCSKKKTDDVCTNLPIKCSRLGENKAFPGDPNIYYICVADEDENLYPELYRCEHGGTYIPDAYSCTDEPSNPSVSSSTASASSASTSMPSSTTTSTSATTSTAPSTTTSTPSTTTTSTPSTTTASTFETTMSTSGTTTSTPSDATTITSSITTSTPSDTTTTLSSTTSTPSTATISTPSDTTTITSSTTTSTPSDTTTSSCSTTSTPSTATTSTPSDTTTITSSTTTSMPSDTTASTPSSTTTSTPSSTTTSTPSSATTSTPTSSPSDTSSATPSSTSVSTPSSTSQSTSLTTPPPSSSTPSTTSPSTSSTTTETPPAPDAPCSTPMEVVPDPDDCLSYYECLPTYKLMHVNCIYGFYFNREQGKCVYGPCPYTLW